MSVTVKVEGIEELEKKMGKLKAHSFIRGLMVAAANDLVTFTAPYPSAPPYGGKAWYERGFGSRWRVKDGSIHGRRTSENINQSWSVKAHGSRDAIIKNEASYSGYVHDKDKQVGFHAARGWRTLQDMWEKHTGEIVRKVADAIHDVWGG